jgi:hypothetical protein
MFSAQPQQQFQPMPQQQFQPIPQQQFQPQQQFPPQQQFQPMPQYPQQQIQSQFSNQSYPYNQARGFFKKRRKFSLIIFTIFVSFLILICQLLIHRILVKFSYLMYR